MKQTMLILLLLAGMAAQAQPRTDYSKYTESQITDIVFSDKFAQLATGEKLDLLYRWHNVSEQNPAPEVVKSEALYNEAKTLLDKADAGGAYSKIAEAIKTAGEKGRFVRGKYWAFAAMIFLRAGKINDAEKSANNAIAHDGIYQINFGDSYVYAYDALAHVKAAKNEVDSALGAVNNAVSPFAILKSGAHPEALALAYSDAATLYAQKGDNEKAIKNYSYAIEQKPEVFYYYSRGVVYYHTQALDSALADFSKVIALRPDIKDGYIGRALIYDAQKKYDLERADLQKILEIDPANQSAKQQLQLIPAEDAQTKALKNIINSHNKLTQKDSEAINELMKKEKEKQKSNHQ